MRQRIVIPSSAQTVFALVRGGRLAHTAA
jgi:hypothetical protein